ncbi:MAG: hypothetical protein ABH983_00285 [Candidatus Micrarchaeota archaeon]
MRKLQKPPAEELRKKKEEPLAEGLQINVPTDSRGRRMWRKLSDEEIIDFARRVLKENGITGRKELQDIDQGLYDVLKKRGLLDEVGFERKLRSWNEMTDEEIIEIARRVIEMKQISERKALQKADRGLYVILAKRRLLDDVGFERKIRYWEGMSNDEIVEYARKMMKEKEITGRHDLEKADPGLYTVLGKRGLRDDVGFERKVRSWNGMSDDDVVEYARKVIKEREIKKRSELMALDRGLYSVLLGRKLVDRAFAHIEKQKDDQARDAVIDALEAFAANDNNSAEDDVA